MKGGNSPTAKKTTKFKIGTVAQSWKRIEDWLKANDPDRFKSLAKPAKAVGISKLEKATGCKLPKEVIESYRVHDGQTGDASLVQDDESGSYYLSPVKEMLNDWKVWDELIKYGEFEDDQSQPANGIRSDKWFNLKWIPFMSNGGGDSYCIDLDPAKGGKVGQIITMIHEHGRRPMASGSTFTSDRTGFCVTTSKETCSGSSLFRHPSLPTVPQRLR